LGKQMEGDNRARRRKAAKAQLKGKSASQAGITTGASKQPSHVSQKAEQTQRLAEIQRGEDKVAGPDVPRPLRGKGRSRDPVRSP
jgi:hypothetical protein